MNNLIIGIAGGSGSGKTTLALRLKERFGEDEVRLISHDSYYKRHDELPFEERCKLNYDHPDAFDNALLIYHLQELKAGRAIDCPVYDYSNHNRSNYDENGRFLGEFNDDESILVVLDNGEFYITNFDVNNHYEDNIIRLEKCRTRTSRFSEQPMPAKVTVWLLPTAETS